MSHNYHKTNHNPHPVKEYEIMQSIEHANIVRLFGVVVSETSQILLVTELAPLRSLLECLKELSLRSTFNVPVLSDFAKQVLGYGLVV